MIDPNTEDQAVAAAPPSIQPVAIDYKLDASAKSMALQEPAPTPEPFEPPSQMADALRKSAEEMFNQSRQDLNFSIFQATSKNPDEEAAAQKLGAATGVGSGFALRNKNELERRKAMNDAQNLDLTNNNPALANKLIADPQFAAVAHDDLSWWDKYGKLAHSVMFPTANPAWFAESVMQTSMGKAFAGGMQVPQITELQREQALSPNGELTPEKEQQLQALEAQQAQTQKETGGMLNTPASMAGNIVGMGESLAKYTTAGATIGGTAGLLGGPFAEVTVPGGIIAGGTSGFSAGMAAEFSKQAMYANYRQSRLQGLSHEQALSNAHIVGIANAVFNAGALKLVGAPIGAAISSLAAPITESVVVPTAKAILIDYLKAYGLHEIGAFGLGAGLKASEISAAKISGIKTTEGAMNIAEEILTSGVHTAYDFALLNALFPLLPAAAQYRVLKDSEMRQAKFKAKIKFVAENNKTKKRSTEQMQNGIESVTPKSEQFVYVDRDQLNNVLMQSGASAKEIEQILPGVLAQLQAENPEIAINSAHYLANEVASTNIGKALEPNLRMEKGGLSPNEILQQNIDASRVRAESKAAVEQYAKINAGFVESAQKVEDLYFNQLVAAGYKEQEARFHASMIRDFYAVIAAREKKTPEQVQAERPYTIVSEQQARERQAAQAAQQAPAQGSFEQAAKLTLASVEQSFAELGVEQRLTETATTIRPGIIRVAKELQNQGRATNAMQNLIAYADQSGKRIDISPTGEFGANKKRLVAWYKNLGFVENKGANKDFAISATMYREPRANVSSFEQASRADLGLGEQAAFNEASQRPEIVTWAKEKFGDRTAPDGSSVWQNFTEWFGDSKVVDAEGKPMVVYHGTNVSQPFNTFVVGPVGNSGIGIYFTTLAESASEFSGTKDGSQIIPAFVSLKNPFIGNEETYITDIANALGLTRDEWVKKASIAAQKKGINHDNFITKQLKNAGYDGIVVNRNSGEKYIIAFEPTQIKSAIANVGTFGQQDPNILRQSAVPATAMPSVTTDNPVSPIGLAIASANLNEVKSVEESDTFFKKVWKKLLIASGKQMRSKSDESVKEAAKLAVADIQEFVKNNPQFSDYYSQDWMKTRSLLDEYAGRAITDDEFQMYRVICGLTSPNTKLPSNISDTVKLWTHWMENGSFDGFLLGPKPVTGKSVVFESDEIVSGTTANTKIRTVKIIARLVKELGSVKAAINYLREPVTSAELNKVNKSLGYAGNVSNIGNIRALVKMATGQDKLIPRMFVFGQKVGAYTLNAVGDERFTTVDIWESRYIRSFFSGMFENEIGLPTDEKEHDTFVRFGYAFKDEMEKVTGRTWTPSSLQALRWFYIIAATRSAGYSKASTNETISTYTSRVLKKEFDYNQSRKTNATRSTTTPPRKIAPQKYERDISGDLDAQGITDPKQRQQITTGSWIQFARSNKIGDEVGFQFDTDRSGVPRGSGPLKGLATVATHTPGSQLAKSLAKAGANIQPYVELAQTDIGSKAFSDRVRAINANSKFGTAVYVYSDAEYMGKRLFISESGKSGFALSPDGDIVSVFSEAGSREGRGAMALATQMGGTKLDCFDTVLPGYYAVHGFRAVARIKWNDEYTPTGWDFDAFAQFNGGRPDVVYMVYEANYVDSYSNTDGVVVADPSEAVAIQTQDIKTEQDRVAANKARDAEVIKPSQTLFQAAEGSPAGTYDPAKILTTIMKSGNKSTLIHETAHFFLHMTMDTASKEGSSLEAKQDAQVLLDWFGVKDIATWNAMTLDEQRQHHEAFALNWEIYVHEGKAPSVGLQKVFDAFSRYLKRVYVSIVTQLNEVHRKNFGVDLPSLTPEVKGVMDRMLANDAQISQREAIDNIKAQWETQEESGMNDAEWAALKEMEREAHDQAESDLNKASLKQVEWLTKATERLNTQAMMEFKRLRKTVSAEETAKMEKEPLRQAENFLKTGKMLDADGNEIEVAEGFKLDKSAVGAMYPTSTTGLAPAVDLSKLKGMTMDGGLAPDLVAEMFGLSSGDELIRKLVDQKPFKDELQERTDARMEDEHGDLNTEEARQDAANQALHNELRARYIAVQNRFRNKIKTPVAQLMIAVKERSQEILAKMKLKDIRPTEFSSAEAREAKTQQDAHKAMQSPETASKTAYTRSYNEQIAAGVEEAVAVATALEKGKAAAEKAQAKIDAHKEKYGDVMPEMIARKAGDLQELYNRLAKDAFDIKDSISRFVKYTKNVLSDDNRKRMGADAAEQIEGILSRFGLVPPGKEPKMTLEQWVTQQTDKGLPPDIAPLILLKQYSMPFSEMTVEEFADLKDAVKYIEHVSKYENKAMKAARNKSFADFVPLVVKSVLEQNPRLIPFARRTARTGTEKANEAVAKFGLGQQRGGMMIRILDGDKDGGIVSGFLLHTMDAQTGVESEFVTKTTEVLNGLIQPVLAEGKMGGSGELFPNLKSDAFPNGRSLNKEERLAIALNSGNESNLQRLLGGERWTMDQVVPILRTLTDADWNFVEGVWDHFETYKPLVAELERKLNGKEPDWIEPKPFEIKTADGTTRTIKGGYYPVKFDPAAGPQAKIFEDVKDVKSASYAAHGASTTRRGYVKARVEEVHDKPLLLNMNGMYSGFAEVIHDLAWREWLIDANRFMANKEIDKAIRDKYGAPFVDGIRDWIKRIAGGTNSDNVGGVFNFFRHKAVASTMAWKVATLWKHAFDISKTASILGADKGPIEGWKYIFNAAGDVFSNYNEAIKEAFANSPELRHRFNTRFRELNEIKNAVAGQSKYDKFMYTHGLILHHMLWKVTDVWTWHAAAKKYIANGFTNEEAYAMANRALIDSQGSGTVGNLSAVEGTTNPAMKLFTALSHYMINTSNILYVKTKTRTPGAAGTAKLVADYLQAVTVPVIYEELMRHAIIGLFPNKKKKEEETAGSIMKEFAMAHADYLLGSVPVAREMSSGIKEMFGVKTAGYQGPFGLKIIPDTILFARQAHQKEFDAEFRRAAIRLLGDGTGAPASQINSTIDGVEALFKGETMNPLAPILGTRH